MLPSWLGPALTCTWHMDGHVSVSAADTGFVKAPLHVRRFCDNPGAKLHLGVSMT